MTRNGSQRERRRTALPVAAVLTVAVVYFTAGTVGELEPAVGLPLVALQSALVLGQALALLVRRSRPVTAAVVVVAFHCALLAMSGAELGIGSLAVVIAVFHLVRRIPRPRAYPAVGTLALVSSAVVILAAVIGASENPVEASALMALRLLVEYAAPAVVAELVSGRDQLAGAAREKEAFVERERNYLVEQERSTERNALARELHDIAGHHLSGIIVSAQAAGALVDSDPERSRSMLRELEQEARATLVDLRGTVGLLRSDRDEGADERTPVANPGPADLATLVETALRRGQRVDHVETGRPFRLGPIAGTSAYRMVQESLANAAHHAAGAPCTVTVEYGQEEMMILVENGPVEQPGPEGGAGTPGRQGHGLTGMRERAELIGAELTTGPSVDGGWRNTLRVPRPTERTTR
ncbi:sensor histidine kinase [Arthrobacter sp. RIT-PI-e]|uniref:sensor histidine kinase n=1 Tax=Arthrobacter sp. RIT-PI-e TaxID=1681197 RepID=UPI00128FB9F0|nr:histidine kinase [Arthrobacter sp. RIT-PI-e]